MAACSHLAAQPTDMSKTKHKSKFKLGRLFESNALMKKLLQDIWILHEGKHYSAAASTEMKTSSMADVKNWSLNVK